MHPDPRDRPEARSSCCPFPIESERLLARKTAPDGLLALPEPRVRFARMDDCWKPTFQEVKMRTEVFIGIDISKLRLDGFNLVTGEKLEFENNPAGIKKFLKYARKAKPTLITCESTGGLEQPLLLACAEAKLPIAVVNPRQVRS